MENTIGQNAYNTAQWFKFPIGLNTFNLAYLEAQYKKKGPRMDATIFQ